MKDLGIKKLGKILAKILVLSAFFFFAGEGIAHNDCRHSKTLESTLASTHVLALSNADHNHPLEIPANSGEVCIGVCNHHCCQVDLFTEQSGPLIALPLQKAYHQRSFSERIRLSLKVFRPPRYFS